ncbi:SnoaL-like domain [Yersinia intermedia]|uniref:nuclear transport factor 2 family protein n=1 Tax=Yersinia intermedia TaxID=631 RepID=UPI0005E4F7B1|nr:nuclear transport factor 2 family protein [Yersinia intermedia]CNB27458.1 SnoaL-like domain [Yersinia intermedia]CNB43507.1 SnoaL-like domain [Yersinia intermedia]CNF94219.1 SnoaL-like domain [Yersinia intermedia]CRE50749.1 SnoaL-like domain [Yersinia intermedia]
MMNIITPMSGESLYETSADFSYPKLLTEINNKTLFEYSQEAFKSLHEEKKMIYVVPQKYNDKFGIRSIINIITNNEGVIIPLQGMTAGALCSCLLAVDELDQNEELIITSADHYLKDNMQDVVEYFRSAKADAGVLTFESVHPKWAFIKTNQDGDIIQSSEKVAISRNAIAGFFYFKKASNFIEAAKNVIRKQSYVNDKFYISSCLNELILEGAKIIAKPLEDNTYYNFYDVHAINSFEKNFDIDAGFNTLAEMYIDAFNTKDIVTLANLLSDNIKLIDPDVDITGKDNVIEMLKVLFSKYDSLQFESKDIFVDGNTTIIEFTLKLNGELVSGVDIIEWDQEKRIASLKAYLY